MSGPQQDRRSGPNSRLPALSEETVRELITQQAAEQHVKAQELSLRKQELDYQSKHAAAILGAQERDRASERDHARTMERYKMNFAGFIVVVVLAFACLGLYLGKDQIVKDVLHVLVGVCVGAFGGYGYARARQSRREPEEE